MNDAKRDPIMVFVVSDHDSVHGFVPTLEHAQMLVIGLATAEREKGNADPILFEVREMSPEDAATLLLDSAAKCRAEDSQMAFVPDNGKVN